VKVTDLAGLINGVHWVSKKSLSTQEATAMLPAMADNKAREHIGTSWGSMYTALPHLAGLIDDIHWIVKEVIEHAGGHCNAASDGRQQRDFDTKQSLDVPSAANL
jgi:hypothetical protein